MNKKVNTAVADVSENVSKEVMVFGILTNKILMGATVLGFSRSGNYINKEFFEKKLEVFTLTDIVFGDIEEMIQRHAHSRNRGQIQSLFQQIEQIGLNQIIFVMKILEHQGEDLGKIETATDFFLIILRGNLAFQGQKSDTPFSKLLKNDEEKDLIKRVFQLCKENLQDERKQDGVFTGTLTDQDVNWVTGASRTKIPLSFLKRVGIFEIPPTRYDQLTLIAQHLSLVEFFASVGILLSLDIKGSL